MSRKQERELNNLLGITDEVDNSPALSSLDEIQMAVAMLEKSLQLPVDAHIYYYDGKYWVMGVFGEDAEFGMAKISSGDMGRFFAKDMRDNILRYIIAERSFRVHPRIEYIAGLYRPSGAKLQSYHTTATTEIDLDSGKFKVYTAYPKKKDDRFDGINKFLEILFGKRVEEVKKLIAQYAFEDRRGYARPALLLYGARNTGKTLFAEAFMQEVFPKMVTPLPSNYKDYTGFRLKRWIYKEENEIKISRHAMGVLAKEISGGAVASINIKNSKVYNATNQSYLAVLANTLPIILKEAPIGDADNQYLAIKFIKPLSENDEFQELIKEYPDLVIMFKKQMGAFLKDYLLPFYMETMHKKNYGRYGFPIKPRIEIAEMLEESSSLDNSEPLNVIERLLNRDIEMITDFRARDTAEEMLDTMFKSKFLTSALMRLFLPRGYKPAWFIKYCKNIGVIIESKSMRFGKTIRGGYVVNLERMVEAIDISNTEEGNYREFFDDEAMSELETIPF